MLLVIMKNMYGFGLGHFQKSWYLGSIVGVFLGLLLLTFLPVKQF